MELDQDFDFSTNVQTYQTLFYSTSDCQSLSIYIDVLDIKAKKGDNFGLVFLKYAILPNV